MSHRLQLRVLTSDDLPFADSLRALAGWNQTLDDWRRFLAMQPDGCFLAEWDGTPAGTATTLVYGPELAWIGMVLVHPDYRRRGIGRALLGHCIAWLRQRGVRCLKLDATPAGKEVYVGLGFKAEWTLNRWEHRGPPVQPTPVAGVRSWQTSDLRRIRSLTAAAFGLARETLVAALARASRCARVLETPTGEVAAFGLLRPGAQALYLGPVVAASAVAGVHLLESLLATCAGERVFWDIPDLNPAAVACAREHGFVPQRPLTRMCLGTPTVPGDPRQQFALAGPEVG